MNFVEPIRDRKKIQDLRKYLKGEGNFRNYCMIFLGLNSALRISDILSLKWKDVVNDDFEILDFFFVREKKTKKFKKQRINENAKIAIKMYLDSMDLDDLSLDDYLFKSREGKNKSISRRMAWIIIKNACAGVGISECIGTHTMRKTWAYWAYRGGLDIAKIMDALNHSNISETKRYIGITQDEIDDAYDQFMI